MARPRLLLITWEPLVPPPLLLTMSPPRLLLTWDNTCHILERSPDEILAEILRHTLVPNPGLEDDIAGVMRLRLCCKAFYHVVNDAMHLPQYDAVTTKSGKPWWLYFSLVRAVIKEKYSHHGFPLLVVTASY